VPGLNHLPVSNSEDVDVRKAHLLAGSWNAERVAVVDAVDPAEDRNQITGLKLLLDGDLQVSERGTVEGDSFDEPGAPSGALRGRPVWSRASGATRSSRGEVSPVTKVLTIWRAIRELGPDTVVP
jgi:hypothetical protein